MKKLLLLMAGSLLSINLHAGEIKLYTGTTLPDPGTHWFNDVKVVDEGDYVTVTINPDLNIKSDTRTFDVQVAARCTSGQNIQMCAGGNCEKKTEIVKSGIILEANIPLDLKLEYLEELDSANDIPKNITTELTVEELGVASSKKIYTIIMNDPTGSVEVIEQNGEAYFLNGFIHFNLSAAADLTVYDVNGRIILTSTLDGSGSVDLTGFSKGIYLYTLSGKPAGKIIL